MSKVCSRCKKIYSNVENNFHKDKGSEDGYDSRCKDCKKEYRTRYYEKNKEKLNRRAKEWREKNKKQAKHLFKKSRLKLRYDMSIDDYNKLFEKQKGKCKICGIHQSNMNISLSVDHNHKTGNIRGLLCNKCNSMLGLSRDNKLILIKAIKYLRDDK